MGDLKQPVFMYLKAVLFLLIVVASSAVILLRDPSWQVFVLLLFICWASARAYYFAFYVIEHYIDGDFKFSGLGALLQTLCRQKRAGRDSHSDDDLSGKP